MADMIKRIGIINRPSQRTQNSAAVIIDVFRASSSICYMLSRGAKKIYPSLSIQDALRLYKNNNKVLKEKNTE